MPKWFAVYTKPRHEKRVAQHFALREIEYYLPLYRKQRRWKNGLNVTVEAPLFPGYLFVRMNPTNRIHVLEVPGALSVLGATAGQLRPLPDWEIEALRSGLHLRRAEPYPFLAIGKKVRIRSGVLAGIEGIVVRMKSRFRIILTFDLIMRSISVEVGADELEPLGSVAQAQKYPS